MSEISRYWVAKELPTITTGKNKITIKAPYSTPGFTLRLNTKISKLAMKVGNEVVPFTRVADARALKAHTFHVGKTESLLCFDLVKVLITPYKLQSNLIIECCV